MTKLDVGEVYRTETKYIKSEENHFRCSCIEVVLVILSPTNKLKGHFNYMNRTRYKPLTLYVGIFFLFSDLLLAVPMSMEPIIRQVEDVTRYEEQKKIYEAQQSESQPSASVYTELSRIPLTQDETASEACLQIEHIDIQNVTRIDKKVLESLMLPYLHKCDTMHDINTLVKKINNIYITKSYITSRAYIKPQDLSKGHLVISVMEGKVESVTGKGVFTGLVFPFMEGEVLHLRDLETGIEQLNRLQSIQSTMQINPGSEEGSSQIVVTGKQIGSLIHGSLGVNNYGTIKSGKYQFSGSLGWDNPLGINDLLTFNLNTTNKQDNENNSMGNSMSYGFPIGRTYLELIYAKFDYDQLVSGLNAEYPSHGENETFQIKSEYKLFHTKTQKGKFDLSLLHKKNDNYLANVYLDTSSNTLTILQLSYTHHLSGVLWNGHATLRYHRGLDWLGAKESLFSDSTFNKYTLDLTYKKKIMSEGMPAFYHFSFYGQYAKKGIVSSEQIGIGGPYSVRGFRNESQISGNKGFYLRNEVVLHQQYAQGALMPYFALDYGVVSKNEESYGGHIVGIAIGSRFNFYDWSVDLFHSLPIIDSNKIKNSLKGDETSKTNHGFAGFNVSYRF